MCISCTHIDNLVEVRDVEALTDADRRANLPQMIELHSDGAHGGALWHDERFVGQLVSECRARVPQVQVMPGQHRGAVERLGE